jgi:hypothetical protein
VTTNNIPQLNVILDPGASGTKVMASVDQGKPIYFLMPPHCTEINATESTGEDFDASSTWIRCEDTYYAVGILAQQNSSKSIKVKPLKVESAPVKTLAAITIASQKLGLGKKILLSLSIVLPSGESQQSTIYKKELEQLLERKIISPWGALQVKLRLFKCDVEGRGILIHHRKETNAVKNVMVLMLGYRNASFIATQGRVVASKNCCDIGFHSFLQKIISLTSGYSIEQLLLPVTKYGFNKNESALKSALRFSSDSPHRQQELIDLKAAIEQAEIFYIKQLVNWLEEFLSAEVDEIVLAGGSARYIGYSLAEKLAGRIVPSEDDIHMYEGENLPKDIAKLDQGDRFLDIYGLWREVSSL